MWDGFWSAVYIRNPEGVATYGVVVSCKLLDVDCVIERKPFLYTYLPVGRPHLEVNKLRRGCSEFGQLLYVPHFIRGSGF